MVRLQGWIQWHVNSCVLVFNLSLSPRGFFRESYVTGALGPMVVARWTSDTSL